MDRVLEAAPLTIGAGEVKSDRVNTKHTGVFMEVLKDVQSSI